MDKIWIEKLEDLIRRRQYVNLGGGEKRIEVQHAKGKLTARERLSLLFDEGIYTEVNDMVLSRALDLGMEKKKKLGDGVVCGYGMVGGRMVFASSQDFTVSGGALGETQAQKICRTMDLALDMKAPYIAINDSGGARIEEGIDGLSGYGDIFYRNTMASGVIPQISVILGPCAGGACYSPAITDFIFMTEKNSQMYITGPSVVEMSIGEKKTSAELGGAFIHSTISGVAHFVYSDERACIEGVRKLLSYLPSNNNEAPPDVEGLTVDRCDQIPNMVPGDSRKPFDIKPVIKLIIDMDSLMEVQSSFAKNIVVGFARLSGRTIGVVANQSNHLGGALDINSSDKAARFIRFCDCFHIPIVTFVDVPGFLPGSFQEHAGIIRHGAKLLYAYAEATVPKISLIMRKAYGGAYIAMNSKGLGADMVFAWPTAEIAVMGADGAVSIIGRKEIEQAKDPDAKKEELKAEYTRKLLNPYVGVEHGYVDEVIAPGETHDRLVAALTMLVKKDRTIPRKKHGSIPL